MNNITADLPEKCFTIDNNGVKINGISLIQKPGMLFVYADWCGHCTRFKPIYDQLSQTLNNGNPKKNNFPCYAINEKNMSENLKSKLNVQGYPTIKYFNQDGYMIGDYNKQRDISTMLKDICDNYQMCFTKY